MQKKKTDLLNISGFFDTVPPRCSVSVKWISATKWSLYYESQISDSVCPRGYSEHFQLPQTQNETVSWILSPFFSLCTFPVKKARSFPLPNRTWANNIFSKGSAFQKSKHANTASCHRLCRQVCSVRLDTLWIVNLNLCVGSWVKLFFAWLWKSLVGGWCNKSSLLLQTLRLGDNCRLLLSHHYQLLLR